MSNHPKQLEVSAFIRYNDFAKTVKVDKTLKQNFTAEQYVQLAKEQFCRALNQYTQKRDKKNYFSKSSGAASAIMRTILDSPPDQQWQVKKLAEITGKAIGTVSNVKSFLLNRTWIEEFPYWFEPCNIREMLYEWAKDYHM